MWEKCGEISNFSTLVIASLPPPPPPNPVSKSNNQNIKIVLLNLNAFPAKLKEVIRITDSFNLKSKSVSMISSILAISSSEPEDWYSPPIRPKYFKMAADWVSLKSPEDKVCNGTVRTYWIRSIGNARKFSDRYKIILDSTSTNFHMAESLKSPQLYFFHFAPSIKMFDSIFPSFCGF